jgi:hypothetical protein
MKKWIRPWPWVLASLGLGLVLHSVCFLGFLEGAIHPQALPWAGIAAGGTLLAGAAWALWHRRLDFDTAGERFRAAGWVTGISAPAFLLALFPGSQGRPWVEACLWAGLLGLPLPLFCWYRALELPLLRRALRDS